MKIFFVQFFCVFLPPFLNIFCFGRGDRSGEQCKSMADSWQCMANPPQYCNVISLQLIKINGKKKSSTSIRSIPFLSFIEPIFAWNVPLVPLIFLKRSLVFPILLFSSVFALITEEGFLISPCYSLELCIQMGIFFLFSFAFHFSSFLSFCKAPSNSHFAFLFLGDGLDLCLLYSVMNLHP